MRRKVPPGVTLSSLGASDVDAVDIPIEQDYVPLVLTKESIPMARPDPILLV